MPTLDVAINALRAKHGAKQFDDSVRKIKRSAGQVDKSVKSNTKSFKGMGDQMRSVVIGMVGLAAAYKGLRLAQTSVKELIAFEMELANVSTMLDDQTLRYLPGYEDALSNLAVKYGEATSSLSKGLYDILSASIPAGEALELLEVAARTAIGGFTSTATTVDVLTTIINAYGMEAEDAAKISDILSATVKRGKITFEELANSIGHVIAIAGAVDLSFEQVAAAIATMTRAGIDSNMAMTALKGIIVAFMKPMKEASELAETKFGLAMNTATLQTIGLTGALEKLQGATKEEIAILFPNIRALLGVAATYDSLSALIEDYEGILKTAGLSEINYQKAAKTTGHQLERNRELFKQIKRDLGKGIKPALDLWMAGFEPFVKEWHQGWQAMLHDVTIIAELINLKLLPTRENIAFVNLMLETDSAIEKLTEGTIGLADGLERIDKMDVKVAKIDMDEIPDLRNIRQYTEEQKAAGKAISDLFKELRIEKELTGLTTDERERAIKVMEFEAIAKKMGIADTKKLVEMYKEELKGLQKAESKTEYLDDRASAYRRLYSDLEQMGKTNFSHRLMLLDKEKASYAEFINDKALLDEWYAERKAAIDSEMAIASSDFFAGMGAQVEYSKENLITWGEVGQGVADTLKSATTDAVISMTTDWHNFGSAMEGIGISVAKVIQRMIAEMIAMQIISAVIGGFGGAIGGAMGGGGSTVNIAGSSTANPMAVFGAPAGQAKGNVFSQGIVVPFEKGGILAGPTIFPMSNGGIGLAGEAGKEAFMPLGRDSQGRLSVRTDGDGGEAKQPIKIINIMDFSQIEEYLGTGDGERQVVNIMRRNANELQEISG